MISSAGHSSTGFSHRNIFVQKGMLVGLCENSVLDLVTAFKILQQAGALGACHGGGCSKCWCGVFKCRKMTHSYSEKKHLSVDHPFLKSLTGFKFVFVMLGRQLLGMQRNYRSTSLSAQEHVISDKTTRL